MPFNEALFWFGIAALGVGPFFIFEGGVKKLYGIGLTVVGVLACAYSVYRHHHPEALPQIPFWIVIWVLTWALLGYNIYLRRLESRDITNWRKLYLEENQQRTHFQKEYASAANRVAELEGNLTAANPTQLSALELSSGLSALPVYAQDLEIELLSIKRGVDYLKFDGESLFLHLKMFSPVDAGFRVMAISLWIGDVKYTEEAPSDLSDWYLVKEVDSRYYFTNMNDLSLWKEVQQSGLSAGLHKHGWVGIRVSNVDRIDKDLKKIKISLERAGSRDLYKFIFRGWKECEDLVLSHEMKNNRFPRSPD